MQRQAEEEKEELAQTRPLTEQITPLVQRQVPEEEKEEEIGAKQLPGQTPEVTPNIETRINAIRGGGQPLHTSTRAFFEPRFGYDFRRVRVHTDAEANTLNSSLNAQAFTTGQDVFFRQGAYNPGSSSGRKLLAHELTHIVQQTGGGFQHKPAISQEADWAARTVMQQEQQAALKAVDEGLVRRQMPPEEEKEEE